MDGKGVIRFEKRFRAGRVGAGRYFGCRAEERSGMTGLAHMAVSSALYRCRRLSLPVVYGLGFASHFLLDRIPHYELGIGVNLLLAAAGGLYLLYLVRRSGDFPPVFAALAGVLPDGLVLGRISPLFTRLHDCCHFHCPAVSPAWLLPELALVACSFWVLRLPGK